MKEYAVQKFLRVYGKSFPLRKKFNFTGFCFDVKSLIDEHYDYLLNGNEENHMKKKKMAQIKRKLSIDLKNIEFNNKIYFENKRKKLLKKQKLMLSSHNNKMMLDLMYNNKRYIKYLTENNILSRKTRNYKKISEKTDDSISNNLTENNKTKEIFSSLNTYESINEFNPQKTRFLNLRNTMNKTFSKFMQNNIKSLFNKKNLIFKTSIQFGHSNIYPSIRNSLFNIHSKNDISKYNINSFSKFPNLSNKYISFNTKNIKTSEEIQDKKNSKLTKTSIIYNNNLRKKITFNNIQPNENIIGKISENNNFKNKLGAESKKKNLFISNSNHIRFIKSNIFKEGFNPIKTIYKKKLKKRELKKNKN